MPTELIHLWSDNAAASLAIWLFVLVLAMYLGRSQSHALLQALARSIYRSARLGARALSRAQQQLRERNRAVLQSAGEQQLQRAIEREFVRVNSIITRDLAHYPSLHRQISDTVSKIEKDYEAAIDTPPMPPAWVEVVETVAAIPRSGDAAVAKILDKIHETVESAQAESLQAYQKSSQVSHKLLSRMQPLWRKLDGDLADVKQRVDSLEDRASVIDGFMTEYRAIRSGAQEAMARLTSSSLTQFFVSALVLIIAVFGGLINFQLIAMPMSEMVGGTSYIGAMKTSDIAALVIIMVEIAMGLFLLESLRITHLFPMIGSMDDKMRRRMVWITFTILTVLATIEASLAYMRDLLALDREALKQSLAGASVVEANFRWIPSVGQMVMGFVLPFALAFVAIPLESFIQSTRTVLGMFAEATLKVLAVVCRLLGAVVQQMVRFIIHLYDLVIMVPLAFERWISAGRARMAKSNDSRTEPGLDYSEV
ncbi:hypothetical protein [Simiduia agarivorans]|uniref:Uncharacterized protein n=1 Tax=Simiduia agarivorans (strain DSM 21679 / JCM 13881 / BCRC 17597 / SA1) TaxID=1117647 RepID=K4KR68_SIMAS|nr:hypothetical protein [Simiduia agarivorans]AFV00761.1 hypothetical protein M5M_18160 [Simiduia agarivorans SA1 = DSM 21679]